MSAAPPTIFGRDWVTVGAGFPVGEARRIVAPTPSTESSTLRTPVFGMLLVLCQAPRPWASPQSLIGGGDNNSFAPKPTYPQKLISPRISATFF